MPTVAMGHVSVTLATLETTVLKVGRGAFRFSLVSAFYCKIYPVANISMQWMVRCCLGQSVVTTSASTEAPARMTPANVARGSVETTVCTLVSALGGQTFSAHSATSLVSCATHSRCVCIVLLLLCVQIVQIARTIKVNAIHSYTVVSIL